MPSMPGNIAELAFETNTKILKEECPKEKEAIKDRFQEKLNNLIEDPVPLPEKK